MKTKLLYLLIVLFTVHSQAEVRPKMQRFFLLVEKLQEAILNEKLYYDKKNQVSIQRNLAEFTRNVSELKKDISTQGDDFKFRFEQLSRGLNEAELSFKDGHKDYSYWILKSTLNNCFGCHTQKSLTGTDYKFNDGKKASMFSRAEFLFIVRNYKESVTMFEKIVLQYPNAVSVEELESALHRLAYYTVRVSKDTTASIELFERLLKNKNLPNSARSDLLAWKKYLNIKKFNVDQDISLTTSTDLEKYISARNNLAGQFKYSSQRLLIDLETSQNLYQLLEINTDKSLKPWLLYWLGYQEKDYRLELFDNSAERYLEDCIENHTSSPAAQKCFDLYKDMQIDSFTGSRGTDIPSEVQARLKRYEKLILKK